MRCESFTIINYYKEMEGIFMALNLSYEELLQKVEALQQEIDDCRKTREISQNKERKYRSLVENANEAILVAQNGVFQFANPSAEELFGYSEKELCSKPLAAFIHREELDVVMERHERGLKGEIRKPFLVEYN